MKTKLYTPPQTRGFTLIETIIYVSILSSMLLTTYLITYSYINVIKSARRSFEIERAGLYALEVLEYQIDHNLALTLSTNIEISTTTAINSLNHKQITVKFSIENHDFSLIKNIFSN